MREGEKREERGERREERRDKKGRKREGVGPTMPRQHLTVLLAPFDYFNGLSYKRG